ncbi:unnamed protein product [Cuscuta campestris]|uniref:F-box domain-containing protein n=1 Tax=Cuscuta campestris TaxID=132261 RepID=A0A484LE32_9ASTE|nr:unnamed protein product [Cuscuta campestris]
MEGPAEKLPLEVIGDILSRVRIARDMIRASVTCRRWREAYVKHLHTLSFNDFDDRVYHELPTCDLEVLITTTIFQTPALRKLCIQIDDKHEFSAGSVVGFSSLENVGVLEIGCEALDGFWEWAEKVLRRCPNVRKLIIRMIIEKYKHLWGPMDYNATTNSSRNKMLRKYHCEDLAERTSSAVEMMRKYPHLRVEFVYVYQSDR